MTFARGVLWLVASVFAAFGAGFSLFPRELALLADIDASTPSARVELASLYGGMELGIAAFLAHCALGRERIRTGLVAAGYILSAVALVRTIGILMAGPVRPVLHLFLALEAVGAILALWAASRARADPSPRIRA